MLIFQYPDNDVIFCWCRWRRSTRQYATHTHSDVSVLWCGGSLPDLRWGREK